MDIQPLDFKTFTIRLYDCFIETGDGDDLPGLKVIVRELDDVLFRDVGNKIRDSGK